jgi:hypothetical protein
VQVVDASGVNLDEAKQCKVRLIVDGSDVDTGAVGTKLAADADKLASYGEGLKALAAATDLADQQAALQKLSTSVRGVMQAAGVPGVEAVGDLVADLLHQAALNHRREELLAIARKADPAISSVAQLLTAETVKLQQNIVLADSQTVSELQGQFLAAKPVDPNRKALAEELIAAVDDEQRAAALKPDFSALADAHTKMIQSLANPKVSLASAIAEISALSDELNKVRAAFTPSKKKAA